MTTANTTDRGRRRVFTILGVALGILLVIMGAMLAVGNFATETTQTSRHQAQAVEFELHASGSIEIVADPNADTITIERTSRDPFGALTTEERVVDEILIISSSCGVWSNFFIAICDANYRLEVPADTELSGFGENGSLDISGVAASIGFSISNGEITVDNVEGSLRLDTSNGEVQVSNTTVPGGLIELDTSNGEIRLSNVTADQVIAGTSNGSIEAFGVTANLRFTSSNGRIAIMEASSAVIEVDTSNGEIVIELAISPDQLVAETSNGSIDIVLPAGAPAYAIDANTSNGTTDFSDVATDPDSPFSIDAESDNGDISIRRSS